jgi:hypothetical protein
MTSKNKGLLVASGAAALVVCAAAGGAGAAGLIGSRDIANDSIRSVDLKDGTLAGRDVRDGSLSGSDFAQELPVGEPGPTGPMGQPGPTGSPGPPGALGSDSVGPDKVFTWTGHYDADGRIGDFDSPLMTSADTLPPHSMVRGNSFSVTGDHSSCTGGFAVWVTPENASFGWLVAEDWDRYEFVGPRTHRALTDQIITNASSPTPLHLQAACGNTQAGDLPVPSFDFTVTFSVTQLAAPPTTTMN